MVRPRPGLNVIYARSSNYCIGHMGALPWNLPLEYRHFEQITQGYPVIMGRRTYEDHEGLLPNSLNIIVSSNPNLTIESGGLLAHDLSHASEMAAGHSDAYFVIGGARLINEAIPKATTVFETIVATIFDGDTYIDAYDFSAWKTSLILEHETDALHEYPFQAFAHQAQS